MNLSTFMAGAASTVAARARFLPAVGAAAVFSPPPLIFEASTKGALAVLVGTALALPGALATGFFSAVLVVFGAGLAGGVFFFVTGFAFFGAGLRNGFLGFANLTLAGFFFDLVAIERFVARGAAPEDDRRWTPCRDDVRATGQPDSFVP